MVLSVLIVCLGNICRSPMGEAVLRHEAKKRGIDIEVDSAGTAGYHIGEVPDHRTIATCRKHNIPLQHKGRQVQAEDFTGFHYILAADNSNLANLMRIKPPNSTAKISLWGSYLDGQPIEDPWYGDSTDFEECFKQCTALTNAFLDKYVEK